MPDIFFAGDHHFHHKKLLSFTNDCGETIRKFSSMEEHDEYLIDQHNKVVGPYDKVYFLGDVVINKKGLQKLGRLNGKKRLVRGNHDIFPTSEYMKYFEEIYGIRVFTPRDVGFFFCATHVPVHQESLKRWGLNVHGHLHSNVVRDSYGIRDPNYLCVSMERLNDYKPTSIDHIRQYAIEIFGIVE